MGNVLLTLSLCIIAANALFDLGINCWSWWRRLSYTPEIHEVGGFDETATAPSMDALMQEVQAFAQEIVGKGSPVRAALIADFTERLSQREKVALVLLSELVNRDGAAVGMPLFSGYVKDCLDAADVFLKVCKVERDAAAAGLEPVVTPPEKPA